MRRRLGRPLVVIELAALGALISAAVIVVTAAGSAQVLASEGSDALPFVYILLAVVSVPLASGISAALGRWSTGRTCRGVSLMSVLFCLLLRGAVMLDVPGAPHAACVSAYVFEIVFDTLFWLTVSEYLPTRDLRRHTPFLAMAFSLGGMLGGLVATLLCAQLPADDLLLLTAILFAFCFWQSARIERRISKLGEGDDGDDQSSVIDAFRSTMSVVRVFPLTATIACGILLMSSLFCLQDYLVLTIYADSFSDKETLSGFLAVIGGGQQAAELLTLGLFGRIILERAYPLQRNLLFPITTIATLVALMFSWGLPAAVLVHLNASAFSNAIFEPVKTLNYAALPFRALAPVRMLAEGVIYPAGVALSGLVLMLLQKTCGAPEMLFVALTLAVLLGVVSAAVGKQYLPSLLRSLRLRAIAPAEYRKSRGISRFSRNDIRHLLAHQDAEARLFGKRLARSLAPDLLHTAESPDVQRRSWTSNLLLSLCWPLAVRPVETYALVRSDIGFYLSDSRYQLVQSSCADFWVGTTDRNPRGGAAQAVEPQGHDVNWTYKGDSDAGSDKRSRASLVRPSRPSTRPDLFILGRGFEDSLGAIRAAAVRALAECGGAALPMAARRLHRDRPEVARAAALALGGIRTRKAKRVLRDHLRPLYRQAKINAAALTAVHKMMQNGSSSATLNALVVVLKDRNASVIRRILAVKSELGDGCTINWLHTLIAAPDPRVRSNAIEALASLPTGRLIRPALHLLEVSSGSLASGTSLTDLTDAPDDLIVLARAAEHDRWVHILFTRLLAEGRPQVPTSREETMLDLLLFLKTLPLFRDLSFEKIALVAEQAKTRALATSDSFAVAGTEITEIHVVRSGTVELCLEDVVVERATVGAIVGDAALLGEGLHEVSAQAASETILISFPANAIADIVAENPELLRPVVKDMIRRVNALHAKLAGALLRRVPPQRHGPLSD